MKIALNFAFAVLCLAFLPLTSGSQEKPYPKESGLDKTSGTPNRTHMNINHLSSPIYSSGWIDHKVGTAGTNGLVYPKESGKSAVYQTGLMWAFQYGPQREIRMGGNYYGSGMQAGKILPGLIADSAGRPWNRIYRVRKDIPPGSRTADVSSEIRDAEGTASQIYDQYQKDWQEWPWQSGAPFDDKNNDGRYDPSVDVPGKKGADQTIWTVANDLNPGLTSNIFSTLPSGMEMQLTAWAYDRQDGLGFMYFSKYLLINKSSVTFDSTYVTIWCDPDMGDYRDDLVGCDTTRSLGFVYNGKEVDNVYSPLPPPAIGFDFFQGPTIPGKPTDSALFNREWVRGKRNLPMTTFYGFDYTVPDRNFWDPSNVLECYNLFKGLNKNGSPIIDPTTGGVTRFRFAGDPEKRTGWIDGKLFPPGDRRLGSASGPFTMTPGDSQEVVIAEIAAGAIEGSDRISAIGLLKFYDDQGQIAYNNQFDLASAPPAPKVTVAELDREIILTWGDDIASVNATESSNSRGYAFQGYTVYQFPTADAVMSAAKRLGTFDIVDGVGKIFDKVYDPTAGAVITTVRQYGSDAGIQRSLRITSDIFHSNNRLVNGTPYYLAVTAYNFNPDQFATPSTLETTVKVITATPHLPDPGTRYASAFGDTVKGVVQSVSSGGSRSDGSVIPLVVDPTKLTGHAYRVSFEGTAGQITWSLSDQNTTQVRLSKQSNQTGDDTSPMADGMQIKVLTAPNDFKYFQCVANGTGKLSTPDMGTFGFNSSGFPFWNGFDRPQVANIPGGGMWGITSGNQDGATYDYTWFISRTTRAGANWGFIIPYDFEIRFTAAGGKALNAYTDGKVIDVPFELWNVGSGTPDDPKDDYRMIPYTNDVNGNDIFDLDKVDHPVSGGDNDPETDWIYWRNPTDMTPGQAGYNAAVASGFASGVGPEVFARMVLVNFNGGSVSSANWPNNVNQKMPATGTIFRILTTKPNNPTAFFVFTAPQNIVGNADTARDDIKQINVFPNPYYAVNPQEVKTADKFVTFSHLPPKAIVRIFNMGGVMVRRLDKDTPSQFLRWDLKNEFGLPVGSGLYIAYIEMPELGVTKTLKLAIVQEQQVIE